MLRAILALLISFTLTAPAIAQTMGIDFLIIDPDKNGTNLRDAPKGKIIKVIHKGKSEAELGMRQVTLLENNNGWFRVKLNDGTQGWMHHSVLGTCASGTEDGNPHVWTAPSDTASSIEVKDGTKLYLENGLAQTKNTTWVKISYYTASGKKRTGWASIEVTNPNPYNNCYAK